MDSYQHDEKRFLLPLADEHEGDDVRPKRSYGPRRVAAAVVLLCVLGVSAMFLQASDTNPSTWLSALRMDLVDGGDDAGAVDANADNGDAAAGGEDVADDAGGADGEAQQQQEEDLDFIAMIERYFRGNSRDRKKMRDELEQELENAVADDASDDFGALFEDYLGAHRRDRHKMEMRLRKEVVREIEDELAAARNEDAGDDEVARAIQHYLDASHPERREIKGELEKQLHDVYKQYRREFRDNLKALHDAYDDYNDQYDANRKALAKEMKKKMRDAGHDEADFWHKVGHFFDDDADRGHK